MKRGVTRCMCRATMSSSIQQTRSQGRRDCGISMYDCGSRAIRLDCRFSWRLSLRSTGSSKRSIGSWVDWRYRSRRFWTFSSRDAPPGRMHIVLVSFHRPNCAHSPLISPMMSVRFRCREKLKWVSPWKMMGIFLNEERFCIPQDCSHPN